MKSQSKDQLITELTTLLRDLFEQRREGVAVQRLARAHGYVDGYMRVMLESGVATKSELLGIVARERETSDGPAVQVTDSQTVAA